MRHLLLALLLVPLLFLAAGLFLPGTWRAESSAVLAAERAEVVARVADLETWPDWTAWNRPGGPGTTWTFEGAAGQPGSRLTWQGPDEEYGTGALELTAVGDEVRYRMELDGGTFLGLGGFRFEDVEGGTRVTWFGHGELGSNPLHRWTGLVLDGLVEKDFEKGLAGLERALAED